MAHFPNFRKIFENPALPRTTSYGLLAPCQNLEKGDDKIPKKCRDRRKNGRKDGQNLFHSTLLATVGCPKRDSDTGVFLQILQNF